MPTLADYFAASEPPLPAVTGEDGTGGYGSRQPYPPTSAPPPAYYGTGPGFDWLDIPDWAWSNVGSPALHGVTYALDVLGRPVRTAIAGRSEDILPSIYDTSRATTPEAFAEYVAPEWYLEHPTLTTLGTSIVADPMTWLTAGTTKLGGKAISSGLETLGAMKNLSTPASAALAASKAAEYASITGRAFPELSAIRQMPHAIVGLEPTLAGRMAAGQSGLKFLGKSITPVNQALAPVVGAVEPVADKFIEILGQLPGMKRAATFFRDPNRMTYVGALEAGAEGRQGGAVFKMLSTPAAQAIWDIHRSGLDEPTSLVANRLADTMFREIHGEAVLAEGVEPLLQKMGAEGIPSAVTRGGEAIIPGGMREKVILDVGSDLLKLSPENQIKAYMLAKEQVQFAHQAAAIAEEYGAYVPRLGSDLKAELTKAELNLKNLLKAKKPDPGAIAEAELLATKLRKQVNDMPTYTPRMASEDIEMGERLTGFTDVRMGAGSVTKDRSRYTSKEVLAGGKTAPDWIEGIPRHYAEQERYMTMGGMGSQVSQGVAPTKTVPLSKAIPWMFNPAAKPGTLKEMAEEAAPLIKDPAEAAYKYAMNLGRLVRKESVESAYANVARAIPVETWNQITDQAYLGLDWNALKKQFENLTLEQHGVAQKLEDILPASAFTKNPREILVAGHPPPNFRLPRQQSFAGNMDGMYLPSQWADSWEKYVEWSGKKTGEFLTKAIPAWGVFNSMWKGAQTVPFPTYHTRNLVSDLFRMAQERLLSPRTAEDLGALGANVWKPYTMKGFPKWEDMTGQLFAGQGAHLFEKFPGELADGYVPMGRVFEKAGDAGIIDTGFNQQVMMDGYEKAMRTFKGDIKSLSQEKGTGVWDKTKRFAMFRENALRVSAMMEAVRQGHGIEYAAARSEQALFNYARVSPFVDLMRRTGVAPFLTFSAKNIPAQVKFMFEKPGEFLAMKRIFDAWQGGMPRTLLDKYAKDKAQIDLGVEKGPDGKEWLTFRTASGVFPLSDLYDVMTDASGFFKQQEGPLLRMAFDQINDTTEDELRNPLYESIAQTLIGRPYTELRKARHLAMGTIDPKTGRAYTEGDAMDWASWAFSPIPEKRRPLGEAVRRTEASREQLENKVKGFIRQYEQHRSLGSTTAGADLSECDQKIAQWKEVLRQMQAQHATERMEEQKYLKYNRAPAPLKQTWSKGVEWLSP